MSDKVSHLKKDNSISSRNIVLDFQLISLHFSLVNWSEFSFKIQHFNYITIISLEPFTFFSVSTYWREFVGGEVLLDEGRSQKPYLPYLLKDIVKVILRRVYYRVPTSLFIYTSRATKRKTVDRFEISLCRGNTKFSKNVRFIPFSNKTKDRVDYNSLNWFTQHTGIFILGFEKISTKIQKI